MAVGNPITELSTTGNFVPVTRTLTINGVSYDLSADRSWSIASPGGGSVTSVAMTVPTGFSVSGSPITSAGTLAVTFASGYALPTTVKQSNWDDAYTFVSNFPSQTGNNGKFLYTSGSVLSWQTALQNPMTALGDMLFGGVSGAVTVLPGNQFTTRAYLQQVGTGSGSAAPTWGGIVSTDISGQAITRVNDTNVTLTLTGTPGNSVLNAVGLTMGWTGELSAGRGGTGTSGVSGIMLGNLTAPVTGITGIGGQILRANPSTGVYEFWTPNYLESPFTQLGQIIYSGAGGQPLALNANSTGNNMYLRSVSSGTPAWASIQGGDIIGAGLTSTNDTNVQITLGGTPNNSLLRSVSLTMGWTGQLAVPRGGTGVSTITGVVIGNGTGVMTGVAGTASQLLRRDATNSFYEFFTHNFLSNPMTSLGDIIYGNASGAPIRLAANSTASNLFLRSVSSGAPSWSVIGGTDVTGAAITTANDTNIQITASGNTTNALLRTLTLTAGWTGALSPGRGGTGASTLTGVVIGNGIGTMVGVAGTADQLLRRNSANSAYEFFTPTYLSNPMTTLGDIIYGNAAGAPLRLGANATSTNKFLRSVSGGTPSWEEITGFLTGSGTTNFVPQWTGSSTLGVSALSFVSGEANFGSNKLVAGNTSAPNGSIMLQDNYSTGHLGNIGTMFSGGNLMLGYCVTPSTSSATAFLSSTGLTDFPRSSIVVGENVSIYTGAAQTVTVGSSVTMSERLRLLNSGQLRLLNYTSTASFSGLTVGYLGFTSTGAITTNVIPGGVSGTQDYLAKFDSTGLAVTNSRFIDNGTNFLLNGASAYVTGFNLIGDIAIQSASGQASSILQRSNQTPTSGTSFGILDAYAITTGSTYQAGGGIEFRASQNWNSTSAGTNIFIQTAPDNTIAPADMFVFLNNGAVRFIGRTSNPLSPAAGTMYYNSSANNMRYYNGTTWITF
jgi:hypothetical protein